MRSDNPNRAIHDIGEQDDGHALSWRDANRMRQRAGQLRKNSFRGRVRIRNHTKKLRFPRRGGFKFAVSGSGAFQFTGGAAVVQDEMQ
jgi:ferric-dicitrate binding protein FerR (iron transport regulator)